MTIPKGTHLAQFKEKSGFLRTAVGEHGIVGQAQLNPLLCDPTMLLVAAALANIDKKLDAIQEVQQEMLDFPYAERKIRIESRFELSDGHPKQLQVQLEQRKVQGCQPRKGFWTYAKKLHVKLTSIKSRSKSNWARKYCSIVIMMFRKCLKKFKVSLKNTSWPLYIYGFAYFLEVVLQENYEKAYLSAIAKRIDEMAFNTESFIRWHILKSRICRNPLSKRICLAACLQ